VRILGFPEGYTQTNKEEHSRPLEVYNSVSSQEIPGCLWKPRLHYLAIRPLRSEEVKILMLVL
jgi:hypothetical protein